MPGARKPLTDKQQAFVDEYLKDMNATAAYKRAGYKGTGNTAEVNAARMLRNAKVQDAIQAGLAERRQRAQMQADEVLAELANLARADFGNIVDFSGTEPRLKPANEITEAARKTISSVEVKRYTEGEGAAAREVELLKFKLWDKRQALVNYGQHLGLFKTKIQVGGDAANPLRVHLTGNVTHDKTLEAADAAFAESLAAEVLDAVAGPGADAGTDSGADPALHGNRGPESVDQGRDPDNGGNTQRTTPPS